MLSLIIPTYNERDNLATLIPELFSVFHQHDITVEVIVVDDGSADGTGAFAESLKTKYPIQLLQRGKKLGLASAFLDGIKLARYDMIGLMDADLSHPPEIIPKLLAPIQKGEAELVFASRSVPGGQTMGWPWYRHLASWFAQMVARPLVGIRDTTSGFFLLKKEVISGVTLFPHGFKIGLEIAARGNYQHVVEIPYTFQDRSAGSSKFGIKEILIYGRQLATLYKRKILGKIW